MEVAFQMKSICGIKGFPAQNPATGGMGEEVTATTLRHYGLRVELLPSKQAVPVRFRLMAPLFGLIRFDSLSVRKPIFAGVAQKEEQLTCNQQVGGSIPSTSSSGM